MRPFLVPGKKRELAGTQPAQYLFIAGSCIPLQLLTRSDIVNIPDQSILRRTLYDPWFEHDACGIGFVANTSGNPSHTILAQAIEAVSRMSHRGAVAADARTGDGAGVLTQLPIRLLLREAEQLGISGLDPADLAVGMIFLPGKDLSAQTRSQNILEESAVHLGFGLIGWRDVPVDLTALGDTARQTMPRIRQLLLLRPPHIPPGEATERALYLLRRRAEKRALAEGISGLYIPSLSTTTICYKGLMVSPQLPYFYLDLRDPLYQTAIAVFHQRYSTNTFPTWERAQPFRLMCHNGEINTLQGNVNWMQAREPNLQSRIFGADLQDLLPVIDLSGSDSAMVDNTLELITRGGRDIRHAMLMLMPEAWQNIPDMDPEQTAFYRYHSTLMEPWDGPAAITFTDGQVVGTILDRNGLRPARYLVTDDGLVICASEVGAVSIEPHRIVQKGKLGPGQMIAVDLHQKRFLTNATIKEHFSRQRTYGRWLKTHLEHLRVPEHPEFSENLRVSQHQVSQQEYLSEQLLTNGSLHSNGHAKPDELGATASITPQQLLATQASFGYTAEELTVVLRPMYEEGKEPIGSMGDDTPHAVLSQKSRPLFNYFKQRFAEVTNPPIDSLREELVMSLITLVGKRGNLLEELPANARLLELKTPILLSQQLKLLQNNQGVSGLDPAQDFKAVTLAMIFPAAAGPAGLQSAIDLLCQQAEKAVTAGAHLLILSDRQAGPKFAPIPSLLAVGAVHHALIRAGKRMDASIIVESGEAREVHHFAALLGYGAAAINPWLALESVAAQIAEEYARGKDTLTPEKAIYNYVKSIEKGLLKIMSKMGISTIDSYCGAQIFEAIGLHETVIDTCFTHTPSRIGGIGFDQLSREVLSWHQAAFPATAGDPVRLDSPGFYKFKKGGEYHAWRPQVVHALHKAVRPAGDLADPAAFESGFAAYREYAALVDNPDIPAEPRHLLDVISDRDLIPLEQVEPASTIVKRFSTAGMSHGSLSAEAHETLAIAMTRLGAMSNAGEGGEERGRFRDERNSNIKQVASGRFGVTPEYLAFAEELQIKMAQGSKPGEGGQLPGHKVTEEIARIRHTTTGVALISPPPHHDIYSIEDLAQLIFDLKQANPQAKVSVKLVSQAGVGTIAAGVAKGYADVVLISGHSGGTGASPLSSIKNVGIPWELGVAETQQTLVLNNLRGRIRVRTDGGLRTGRDVVIAALLGADEYSFGTSAVVAEGCIMARTCHTNNCPVGVATQRPELRARFPGKPEHVMAFILYVAEDVRRILADMGYHSLNEIIGRTDLLRQVCSGRTSEDGLDLASLLQDIQVDDQRPRRYIAHPASDRQESARQHSSLNVRLVNDTRRVVETKQSIHLNYAINNQDRTIGATLSGEIAQRYGNHGLPYETINVTFTGSAGQSFGAFLTPGLNFTIIGEANDYVGKGLGGGEIVVRPHPESQFSSHENVILGNTVLYGATGGMLFAAGRAGERFAVRNSGARAVVEGVGDHGCEYMTGGVVVILGETGRNFAAGMTGGIAFVLDTAGVFQHRYNPELVRVDRIWRHTDVELLRSLIFRHAQKTDSRRAREILDHWHEFRSLFWRVMPQNQVAQIEAANEGVISTVAAP
ncbi:MAG: glutamate synthase large subunit [Chloroflexi bacterium]|nr:glutamate synthase large subunit [Chloroflexota bacterium]